LAYALAAAADGLGSHLIVLAYIFILNRVHFENHGYAGLQSENAPVRGASSLDCQATVSKVDAV
jgi:hypothetical protein